MDQNPSFRSLDFVAARNFYGSKIFIFGKFELSKYFCTRNQVHNSKTRKSRPDQSLQIFGKTHFDFEIKKSDFWIWFFRKSANFDLDEICEFLSYGLVYGYKNTYITHIFQKSKFWTRRNFWRQQSLRYEMTNFGAFFAKISDFCRNFRFSLKTFKQFFP